MNLHPLAERPIAHGLSRRQLAIDYDVESTVPDLSNYMRTFTARSDQVRKDFEKRSKLDVAYGPLPAHKLDIYLPLNTNNAPVLVFLHGGAWKGSNKECRAFPAEFFCASGAIWISVEYPLAPQHSIETQAESAEMAFRWIHANSTSFKGNQNRILVMGHSAGAHLASTGIFRLLKSNPELSSDFELLMMSGVFDLEPMMFTKVNEWLNLNPALVLENSPICSIPTVSPPLHAFVGGNEPDVFMRQSLDMVGAYAKRGFSSRLTTLPDRNHFSVLEEFDIQSSPLQKAVLEFIRR
jgi:arylformamidase